MKPIVLHPAAEAEMRAAAGYYQDCQPGLGGRFLDEIARTGGRIAHNPLASPTISGYMRCCMQNHFPFGLLYRIETERIYVWRSRVE